MICYRGIKLSNIRSMRLWFIALIVFCLGGCDNGINCPLDPPSCCYDSLFGCGTFDLPQGCSCSQYGLFRSFRNQTYGRAITAKSVAGLWQGRLERTFSTCQGAPAVVSGSLNVKERRGKVTVSVPYYGSLRGSRTRSGFSVSGAYAPLFSLCDISVRASFLAHSRKSGKLVAAVENRCKFTQTACTATYQGELAY